MEAGFNLSGWLSAYRLDGYLQVPWERQPLRLDIAASGDRRGLSAERLALSLGQAALAGRGRLGWEEAIDWQLDLQGRDLNPAGFFPAWPGRLQLDVRASGRWLNRQLSLSVHLDKLQGELRSLSLLGSGEIGLAGDQWRFDQLTASLGANRLQLDGVWGRKVDLKGHLSAPALAQIAPALGGRFMARGHLQGDLPQLRFIGEAEAEELRWQNYALGSLHWQSVADDVAAGQVSVQAEARELNLNGLLLQRLAVSAQGGPESHQIGLPMGSRQRLPRAGESERRLAKGAVVRPAPDLSPQPALRQYPGLADACDADMVCAAGEAGVSVSEAACRAGG